MDPDSSPLESAKQKASALHALVSGPLSSSAAKLFGRSRGIPSEKDFHFYNNFPDFKIPAREIAAQSSSLLSSIGSSDHLWGTKPPPPLPDDLDDAYDWLVSLNDDLFERFGVSMDEFKNTREKEEATGVRMEADGFTLVCGKKKKKKEYAAAAESEIIGYAATGVKVASKDQKTTAARAKVPFHIPTIPRPQQEYNILVNNSNRPFEHVWLEKSDDGSRFVHHLEKLSVEDFVDRIVGEEEPQKPLPVESSPFKFVDSVKELKDLASKLRNVKEFAVDLEHNHYRSFQGMTCLMQISTRTEDFIIDTLKLRVHVGPHLREVFKDPSKRKVMHGADRDILWLQRDFGIYVCNLFDTGQASRVMQLERNSLEYLLHHFCEVNANKEYQTADWRLRPLPEEMLKYAREDTHYLLHIYDLMKSRLLSASSSENDLLLEVYKRSYEVCMQLYEKELLTDTSYLFIYGLQEADFDSKQLAIVYGLCEWRDKIAREEDESTGYILPNKSLLEIARQIPLSPGKLRRLVRSKHPHVERHINTVISIIRSAVENSSYFESISEQLKMARLESAPQDAQDDNAESLPGSEDPMLSSTGRRDALGASTGSVSTMQNIQNVTTSKVILDVDSRQTTNNAAVDQFALARRSQHVDKSETIQLPENEFSAKLSSTAAEIEKEKMDNGVANSLGSAKKVSLASVQIAKKPTSAFGALLGNSFSRRKLNPDNGVTIEQHKNVSVVEQIKSSVSLPFHSFSGREEPFESSLKAPIMDPQPEPAKSYPSQPSETDQLEEIISLESGLEEAEASGEGSVAADGQKHRKWFPRSTENGCGKDIQPESNMEESPMSLSDLSSSFRECFQSINERRGAAKQSHRPNQESQSSPMFEPFDYASARNTMNFGGVEKDGEAHGDDKHGTLPDGREKQKGGIAQGRRYSEERTGGFQQPRRRQAFPQSGNRSSSYK